MTVYVKVPRTTPDRARTMLCPQCQATSGEFCLDNKGRSQQSCHAKRHEAYLATRTKRPAPKKSDQPECGWPTQAGPPCTRVGEKRRAGRCHLHDPNGRYARKHKEFAKTLDIELLKTRCDQIDSLLNKPGG
jgi:hypothetical protein